MESVRPVAILVRQGIHSALLKSVVLPELETLVFNSVESLVKCFQDFREFLAILIVLDTTGQDPVLEPNILAELVEGMPIIRLDATSSASMTLLSPRQYEVPLDVSNLHEISASVLALVDVANTEPEPPVHLTNIQTQFIGLVAQGFSNAEIAKLRGVSVRNIEALSRRTFSRLGLESSATGRSQALCALRYVHEGERRIQAKNR